MSRPWVVEWTHELWGEVEIEYRWEHSHSGQEFVWVPIPVSVQFGMFVPLEVQADLVAELVNSARVAGQPGTRRDSHAQLPRNEQQGGGRLAPPSSFWLQEF